MPSLAPKVIAVAALLCATGSAAAWQTRPASPEAAVPPSPFASAQAATAWSQRANGERAWQRWRDALPPETRRLPIRELYPRWLRQWMDTEYLPPLLARQQAAFDVVATRSVIAGVPVEIFEPRSGIPAAHQDRVLINLHGGGFMAGAGIGGSVESIPIAATAATRVISIDYRMAPEARFPAATDDVVSVYRALLAQYRPENIGIFGCSSGAMLTAQTIAALVDRQIPRPGAVGMFCGTGEIFARGDSALFWDALTGRALGTTSQTLGDFPYLEGADASSPLVLPMRHPELLRRFPPSLLISGTRSFELSSVIRAHGDLLAAGTEPELRIWEGVTHAFLYDPDLPESRQAYDAVAHFFDRNLGRPWYARELAAFLEQDLRHPPAPCGIEFVGSSTIRFWPDLAADMAPLPAFNRGFGGSTILDIVRTFDRTIAPYHPSAVVLYAGENDLAAGRTPAQLVGDVQALLALKRRTIGEAPLYFISAKPSVYRSSEIAQQEELNARIRALAGRERDLIYIDTAHAMRNGNGLLPIFQADNLHMTRRGYDIWVSIIRPILLANWNTVRRACERRIGADPEVGR